MSPVHDYNLANQSGASFRSDLNDALQAILTNNSSASAPSTTAAYMFWADTNTGILKIRNSANSAWIELFQLDGTLTLEDGSASAVALGFRDELNTGIFSSGANNFDVSIAGTTRLNISASGINITGTVTDDGATHDGDVTFTGASANVVFDKSDNALEFADNAKATFGSSADLTISHDGSNSIINETGTGELQFQRNGNTILSLDGTGISIADPDGTGAVRITGFEGSNATLSLICDEGDDNGDTWQISSRASDNTLKMLNNTSGSLADIWTIATDGDVTQTGSLEVRDNASNGIISRSTATQSTNSNKAFKARNNSDTDTFSVSYRGAGYFADNLDVGGNLTVSGTCSGLDADTLDGIPSANFLRSNTTDSFTGATLTFNSSTDQKIILAGSASPYIRFQESGTNKGYLQWNSAGYMQIVNQEAGGILKVDDGVDITGTLDVKSTSSAGKITITGHEGSSAVIDMIADQGDNNGDSWRIACFDNATSFPFRFQSNVSGSFSSKFLLDTNGDLEVTGQLTTKIGTASSPGIAFGTADRDSGFFRDVGGNINVALNGNSIFRFKTSSFHAEVDNQDDLGTSSRRWDDVRATNGNIVTSDRNEKNTITATDLGLDFINKLSPVSYKFNKVKNTEAFGEQKAGTRTHYGLIAQDIETLLGTIGKSATDFAGFCKDEKDDDGVDLETPIYGLRYQEFIAPIIKAIQELSAKVAALEAA